MAKLIKITGSAPRGIRNVKPRNGETFELEELYELLEVDMIEIVPSSNGRQLVVIDEEGKLKQNPIVNGLASIACFPGGRDMIVGNALICNPNEIE